jgi:hypothetical protein
MNTHLHQRGQPFGELSRYSLLLNRWLLGTSFLCELDVSVSLTMDGWSNLNMKGFYVVTAHWIDTATRQIKTLLLTIIDVSSGTGIGDHVGLALYTYYLFEMVGPSFLSKVFHVVTDNGSDTCAAVTRLRVNSNSGSRVLLPSNHVRCTDHPAQHGVISILAQVKEINEKLRGALTSIRRSMIPPRWQVGRQYWSTED